MAITAKPINRLAHTNRIKTSTPGSAKRSEESEMPSNAAANGGGKGMLQALDSSSRNNAMSQGGQGSTEASSEQTTEGAASEGTNAVKIAIATDSAGLEAAKEAMKNNLGKQASDPKAFHDIMKKSFGGKYDKAKAETIRQQVLKGDFSWMPEIKVVDQSTLQDKSGQQKGGAGLGAYSKENDTIYISRQLLASDPAKAAEVLTEEVGHGLDVRLNKSDAAGDEGNIFSRLVGGESISDSELTSLKAENDSGTIVVDGKEVEVEYGWFKKLRNKVKKIGKKIKNVVKKIVTTVVPGGKKIWKAVSKVGKKIYDMHKKAWRSVEKGFKKVMQSKLFGQVLTVLQFVPIPIVALVAKGLNVVRSAYAVYQGIKHGSAAAVLGGIAGVAGGVGGMGQMLGASAKFVNTANAISKGATAAGQGYAALAKGDMRAAAGFAKNYFGGKSSIGQAIGTAQKIDSAVQKGEDGDWAGAAKSAQSAYSDIKGYTADTAESGSKTDAEVKPKVDGETKPATGEKGWVENAKNKIESNKIYQAITKHAPVIQSVVKAAKNGEYGKATTEFLKNYGDDLGLSTDTQGDINKWATVIENVDTARDLVKGGKYSQAISKAAAALGIPLTKKNEARMSSAFSIRDAVLKDNYIDAARHASKLALQTGDERTAQIFSDLADLLEGKDLEKIGTMESQAA